MAIKVLHISKFYYPEEGGIEYFVKDLTEALLGFGVNPLILVHQRHASVSLKKDIINNIQIIRLPIIANISYAPICLAFAYFLKKAINEFKPDILHIHLPNLSPLLIPPSSYNKLPLIIHWHADVVASEHDKRLKFLYKFYRPLEKRLLQKATRIIVTSHAYLETSAPLRAFQPKCVTVPLGINPERLKPSMPGSVQAFERSQKIVLSVGRLTYYKGYEYLIRAMKYIKGAKLIIVGEGAKRKELSSLIKKEALTEKVILTGYLPEPQKTHLLQNCHLFCLPSIERTEAFGLSLLEAMYFGKPLVTTDVKGSGMSFVNLHQKTGLVVPPKDVKALARAINFLLQHEKVAQKYGQNAKNRFEKQFHIVKIAEQIAKLYTGIL